MVGSGRIRYLFGIEFYENEFSDKNDILPSSLKLARVPTAECPIYLFLNLYQTFWKKSSYGFYGLTSSDYLHWTEI